MAKYFTINRLVFVVILVFFIFGISLGVNLASGKNKIQENKVKSSYWFILKRKSNMEFLYKGIPGETLKSELVRVFKVKTGIPNERPTPLPKLLNKKYWLITKKEESKDNTETAPYFLKLNIPVSQEEPFGPVPYKECYEDQCNWGMPGDFGLHGINGDESKLSIDDPGSSGCVRHRDEDITYLYNILNPEREEIRYYVLDE